MTEKLITVLAIESSCDETGVSVVQKQGKELNVVSELVASQRIHEATGGVVPELAAREHLNVIGPMISSAMQQADIDKDSIDSIAVTVGPGLMPALVIGVQAARTLAFAWDKPIVPVHHIEGHIYSALLRKEITTYRIPQNIFPSLALIVSGGHTMLIEVNSHLSYTILGQTRDDAAGEVFDKVARMLQLSYPGGPQISMLAEKGNPEAFAFPRPMISSGNFDFSFSGLKTAVLYAVQGLSGEVSDQLKADIAASFEAAVIDTLVRKLSLALEERNYASILLAGGVAANTALRIRMQQVADTHSIMLSIAPQVLCGDNATMIGQAGLFAYEAGRTRHWREIDAIARVTIENFSLEKTRDVA